MLFAKDESGQNILASEMAIGFCSVCGQKLIPRCGDINVHHWAHVAGDCDTWSEGESEWHLGWKSILDPSAIEVRMGPHRADIYVAPYVIELQNSPIDLDAIKEREKFYVFMIWLFNGADYIDRFHMDPFVNKRGQTCIGFYWEHHRKHVLMCDRPVFIDFGEKGIFEIVYKNPDKPSGWGWLWTRDQFISMYIKNKT